MGHLHAFLDARELYPTASSSPSHRASPPKQAPKQQVIWAEVILEHIYKAHNVTHKAHI